MSDNKPHDELNQTLQSMREEYVQAVPDLIEEEPKTGKEVRIREKTPRWVYTILGVLAVGFLLVGVFVNQQRFADEVETVETGSETAVQTQAPRPTIPPPPPLSSDPPIPTDAVPVPPQFTPIPTPPIDTSSPGPGG